MIGQILGEVSFSDGKETILLTATGVGYQINYNKILPEGKSIKLFISHVFREADQELFGFDSLRSKKLFEMLTTVKGIGPKSAYSLICHLTPEAIIDAISLGSTELIKKTPGIGAKTAAQIILDLKEKIQKIKMYSSELGETPSFGGNDIKILEDTLLACNELGFKDEQIVPLAQKFLKENKITRAEQLIHLVLRGI